MNNVNEELNEIFNSVGVYFNENELNNKIELDSLQFVMVISEIEEKFDIFIGIDGDSITYSELKSFNNYLCMVEELMNK